MLWYALAFDTAVGGDPGLDSVRQALAERKEVTARYEGMNMAREGQEDCQRGEHVRFEHHYA